MNTDENGPAGQPASGPGATAEATTPTIDWPALLEKYRALAQADWDTTQNREDAPGDSPRRAIRILERAIDEANDRLEEIVATIAGAEGNSLEALAVKMAVEWSHIIDFPDLSEPISSEQLLVRSSLDYLTAQTGLDLFICYDRNGRWLLGRSDETDNEAQPDDNLIRLEQEYNRLFEANYKTETEAGQEALDRACEEWNGIYDKIVDTQAHTPAGVAIKVRMLRHVLSQGDNKERDDRAWDSCLASQASMAGIPAPAPSVVPIGDEADAALFSLADECDRLHEIWRKSCEAYSDAEGAMFDKKRRDEPISDAERAKVKEAEERNVSTAEQS